MTRAVALAVLLAMPSASHAGVRPRYGGEITVILPGTPRELDPARASAPADVAAVRAIHATLLELDPRGGLRPGLLAALPETEPDGRALRLRLRPGLRFHDGSPVTAADVAASLSRLAAPSTGSPHGWLALPIEGASGVREGRAAALPGVQVISETELRIALAVPFPDFAFALAAFPTAVVPRAAPTRAGAGPFRAARAADGSIHLTAFEACHRGRPFADRLALGSADARRAERALERGDADLVIRPEPFSGPGRDLPALSAAFAVVNARRLGEKGEALRRVLMALDRSELTRLFVRGRASPLAAALPPAVAPAAATLAPSPASRLAPGTRIGLLVPAGPDALRAVADRIQVKLFDRGIRAAVEAASSEAFASRLTTGEYDVALVPIAFVSPSPALATVQLAWTLGGPTAAQQALTELGAPGASATTVAARVAERLLAVPLFATGLRVSHRPELRGLAVAADGGIDLGELWILPRAMGTAP